MAKKIKSLVELSQAGAELREETKNSNTEKGYAADLKTFDQWCSDHDVVSLPTTGGTIAAYLVDRSESCAVSTLSRAVAAIVRNHARSGLEIADRSAINEQLKAIRIKKGVAQKKVLPLCRDQLFGLLAAMGPDIIDRRDAAILAIGWACALRRSEVCALTCGDVLSTPEGYVITIRRSKTDQEGEGFKLAIPFARPGAFCLCKIISMWARLCPGKETDPFFYACTRADKSSALWSSAPARRRALDGRAVSRIVKKVLDRSGFDSQGFSGHSLRAGFITSCAALGVPEWAIMLRSRHKSNKTVQGYIRIGELFTQNPLNDLLEVKENPLKDPILKSIKLLES